MKLGSVIRRAFAVMPACHQTRGGRTTLNPSAFGVTPYSAGKK